MGGQVYRVVSSAGALELERLARLVDEKLTAVTGGRSTDARGLLLAAMALAHDAEEQRARADRIASGARNAVERLVGQVDDALASSRAVVERSEARSQSTKGR